MSVYLDPAIVRRMWPRAPQNKVDTICRISGEVFEEHHIDDWNVVAEIMGNISHENGAGTIVRESGNYRAHRIEEVFGWIVDPSHVNGGYWNSSARVTAEEAEQLAGHADLLFNRVYGPHPKSPKLSKELGNTEPGDGFKFRGGGDLQLTGRANYTRIGNLTGYHEIIDNPDLLADPEVSFRVAVAEFAALGCIPMAIKGQSKALRVKINGGNNGMNEVLNWVRRWKAAIPDIEEPPQAPRGADTGNKSILSSKIVQSAAGTAATTVVGTVAKVAQNANTETQTVDINTIADKVQKASDTITTVQVATDNATAVIQTVKPFLGLSPHIWGGIALGAGAFALLFAAWTLWERYKKKRDTGE